MMNDWGLPIPGHEYLTFYQMMLRISTGWSQPWLYWSVWQAMLLIREHLWCYLTDNCISSRAPPCSMRCHHRPRRSQRLEFSINNDRRSSQLDRSRATLQWVFKNHSQIFWNNLMPTIFYWMTAKVLSNFTFGDSLPGSPGTDDTSLPAPAVTGTTFYTKYFLPLIQIFSVCCSIFKC